MVNKSFSLFSCPFSHPRSWHRHGIKQSIDQGVGGDPFRLRMEIRQHAMPEDRVRHGPDVVEAHVIAAARQRSRLGTKNEILRRTHAAAKGDPLPDVLRAGRRLRAARAHDIQCIPHHRFRNRHAAHQALERDEILSRHRPFEMRIDDRRRRPDDLEFFILWRMIDDDMKHEPVELRFR
ncbi:MAG TPA: hypothetical protein VFE69_14470 [Ilumatobacteraceae bacterium]|nr:hypothetical protein [Ilumatobacteraceae bacterium]